MSDNHHAGKKERKLVQILKNRRTQRINIAADDALARGRDLEEEREEERKKSLASSRGAAAGKAGEPAWSARMQQVRDKNTGQHRMAKERWNRFAGTESGGGRGL